MDAKAYIPQIYKGLREMDPLMGLSKETVEALKDREVFLIAIGKCALSMKDSLLKKVPNLNIYRELLVTKEGFGDDTCLEAEHPVPGRNSFQAGELLLDLIEVVPEEIPVVVLISGGASSLIEVPREGISDHVVRELSEVLISGGVSIDDANTLRSHVSMIKAGGLRDLLGEKREVYGIAMSDVPVEGGEFIGSGPLSPYYVDRFHLIDLCRKHLPDEVETYFLKFPAHDYSKYETNFEVTLGPNDGIQIIKGHSGGVSFKNLGILKTDIHSGIEIYMHELRKLTDVPYPFILVSGGELGVKVTSFEGSGGRNTHFVVQMAYELFSKNVLGLDEDLLERLFVASIASDGDDGNSGSAGGFFTYEMYQLLGENRDAIMERALETFDSHTLLKGLNADLSGAATGVNVMDFRFVGLLN